MASSVELGNQLESFVQNLVKAGRYNSRSEVLRAGIRIIHERETHLAALDAAIANGVADIENGNIFDIDEVASDLSTKYAKQAAKL